MQKQHVNFLNRASEAILFQHILNKCLIIATLLQEAPTHHLFANLVGDTNDQQLDWRATCAWGTSIGHLRKLNYYYSLIIGDQRHPPPLLKVAQVLNDALLATKECEFALTLKENSLQDSFVKLKAHILAATALFLEHVDTYGKNVHILLFLLRKQEAFDALLGKGTIAKIYLSLFSNGLVEASQFLTKSYSEKGYSHLLPFIQKNFNRIQRNEL